MRASYRFPRKNAWSKVGTSNYLVQYAACIYLSYNQVDLKPVLVSAMHVGHALIPPKTHILIPQKGIPSICNDFMDSV